MRFLRTDSFKRDFQALPEKIQPRVEKALRLLAENQRHPSLRVHKMEPRELDVFEARVSKGYRLTFMVRPEEIILRRVGTHDILRTP